MYGVSSGGALALEAAAAGAAIDKLAVYEVPYNMAEDWPSRWREYTERVATALSEGRRGDAFALFMRVTGSSDADVEGLRNSPMWPGLEAIAHTLAYDAACLGTGQPPSAHLANITQPTLVATGDDRRDNAATWVLALDQAADEIAARTPHAQRRTLENQSHVADPSSVTAMLHQFFANDATARSPDA
jgi:pimeloyl-ACP methyl ester carboxylesterase